MGAAMGDRESTVVLFIAAIALLVIAASQCQAQDAADDPCAELRASSAGAPEPTLLERAGVAGMWFAMPLARLQLCELRAYRLGRREARLVDDELHLWGERLELAHQQTQAAVEAREALAGVVEAAERRARDAEAERDAWYRAPALWFIAGGVAAGLLVALAVGVLAAI